MPTSDTWARLPGLFNNLVGSTTLYIPNQSLTLLLIQNLTKHHSFQFPLMSRHIMIIEMCGNLQPGITDRIQRKYGYIKINQIRIIAVYCVQRTVIKIRTILHCWLANSISPSPLSMNHAITPATFTHRMILCIQILGIISFPPLTFTILFSEFSIIRNTCFRPLSIITLWRLIPGPGMIGMETNTKRKLVFTRSLLPFCKNIPLRSHVHRVPRLVPAIPEIHIVMMITQSKEILRPYFLI